MSVLVNGTSVITAGLDHWFDVDDLSTLALEEYTERDWRLEARLQVKEFRLPPDFRYKGNGDDRRNVQLRVPVLRFPRWSFCISCKRLKKSPLTLQTIEKCLDESHAKSRFQPGMSQVPFVTICSGGHLDDFPFNEWVHRSSNPSCDEVLRLQSRGGGGLEGQVVRCDSCENERSLQGITQAYWDAQTGEERTRLSDNLDASDEAFNCSGARPWLAEESTSCGLPLRASLRGAGNVYFPKVESSIYLPRREGAVSAELHELMRRPDVGPVLQVVYRLQGFEIPVQELRSYLPSEIFAPVSDEELVAGYEDLFGSGSALEEGDAETSTELLTGDVEWRYPEFQRIRETPQDDSLRAHDPGMHQDLEESFSRIRAVDILRETRALRGFTRVRDDVLRLSQGKALLRRYSIPVAEDWLPAYVVKGEGIYIELREEHLQKWEQNPGVVNRANKIQQSYGASAARRGLANRTLSPRLILIHTLGHLLINELIFTCGYSSASLRERLYVSTETNKSMAGLLLYTAAGDSEGTMGGLVRMAKPENLRSTVSSALESARWCSTDPVCMDAGEHGQGPDSCNLAACHGCALLPETSCEEFNRFLDRGMVVGTLSDPALGFFSPMLGAWN